MEYNQIIQGDSLAILKTLPDESVNLVVTSPPYNKGFYGKHTPSKSDSWQQRNIEYGDFKDNLKPEEYINQQTEVLTELVRIIKKDGSIFYNHKLQVSNHKAIFPTYIFQFNLRQIIIWNRKSTPQLAPIRFLPITEYIFWITKTNIQPKFKRNNLYYTKDIWDLPVRANKDHPAPFPIELPKNCILSTTDENDIVLDPYMGIGTTAAACKELKRKYLGIELKQEYIDMAEKRINKIPETLF